MQFQIPKMLINYLATLNRNQVRLAISTNLNLWDLIVRYFHLNNPLTKLMARIVLRLNWGTIKLYMENPKMILEELKRNPQVYKEITTKEGLDWFYRQVREIYLNLYRYAW